MTRSSKKGPYVDERLIEKMEGSKPSDRKIIKTWKRASTITPEMVGFTFGVHNGKAHINVSVTEDMVGHKLGEFSPTTKFMRHGGRMQKELESAEAQKESDKLKAEAAPEAKKAEPKK